MKISAVCLFCGASPGSRGEYLDAARAVGKELAARGIRLVYGGGSVGLMGAAADACLAAGGHVTGVITKRLLGLELGHRGIQSLEVVDTMHQRKARMAELADGFITLPGGMGTLEELSEILSLAQLQEHEKPCGVLNVAGYYDPLRAFLQHMVAERFLLAEFGEMLLSGPDVGDVLDQMERYEPVRPENWIHRKTSGAA
jgi:uncharacterized protein (TIGR00730 family)